MPSETTVESTGVCGVQLKQLGMKRTIIITAHDDGTKRSVQKEREWAYHKRYQG